jgi:hypothetical protein
MRFASFCFLLLSLGFSVFSHGLLKIFSDLCTQ